MTFTYKHGDQPLPGYTIQRGVGRGGFGEVYYALADSGKEVALKFLRDNAQTELRGVTQCLNLKSPYLVTIYDVKQNDEGEYFVIMEFVAGPSLRDLLLDTPPGLGVEKATFFADGIAQGLAYLHERGIVHRDLKPGNIFYEEGYVKIGDYGLSKFISPSQHSGQTMSVGTVHYMAPEIGSGHYQPATDIYALGVILYEMLLGRVPFQGASMGEILMKHLTQQPEVDDLPEPFPRVIRKALAKDPKERYPSADEFRAALLGQELTRSTLSQFDVSSLTLHAERVAARVREQVAVGAGPSGSSQLPRWRGSTEAPTITYARHPGWGSSISRRIGDTVETVGRRIEETVEEVGDRLTQRDRRRRHDLPMFPPRDRLTAGLLAIFLGVVGAHRFYLGYTSIGIIQVLLAVVSAGSISAIWGLAEGVVILCGGLTDVYGRPLARRPADRRSTVIRTLWGVLSVVFLLGMLSLVVVPVFVDAHFVGEDFSREMILPLRAAEFPLGFLWAIAGVPAGLSAFCAWKAGHGTGLSFWRATLRPLLLAICGACIVAAFVLAEYFQLRGPQEMALLFLIGVFALVGALVWQIRGEPLPVRREDKGRENALCSLFFFGAMGCGAAPVGYGFFFHPTFAAQAASLLIIVLGICCALECRYRWGRASQISRMERALKKEDRMARAEAKRMKKLAKAEAKRLKKAGKGNPGDLAGV